MEPLKWIGPSDAKIGILAGDFAGKPVPENPFSCKSSWAIREALQGAGIPYSSIQRATLPSKRPSRTYIQASRGYVKETSEDYKEDERKLKESLQASNLNVIIAMGDNALYALTGEYGIMNWRGSVLPCKLNPDIKVIPILDIIKIYDSFSQDDYCRRSVIHHDLTKAETHSHHKNLLYPNYDFTCTTNPYEAMEWIEKNIFEQPLHYDAETAKTLPRYIGFDTEVIKGQVSCLSFAVSETKALCIAFEDARGETMTADMEARVWEVIAKVLESPDNEIWMQNASFDMSILVDRYGIICNNVKDTMIAQGLITPDLPKGLGFICSMYTPQPYYKDDHKDKSDPNNWNRISDYPSFWRYNCIDSAVLLQAREEMLQDLKNLDLITTFESHCNLLQPVTFMSAHGLQMDVEAMTKEREVKEAEKEKLLVQLEEECGQPINPNSPAQVKAYFYKVKGEKPYTRYDRSTGKSKESVDDDAIKGLIAKGHKEAKTIQTLRGINKYLGTYLKVKLDDNNRMRSSYNPIGTTTGRLASSKNIFGFGTNLQNQPYEMRKFMTIPEGYIGFAPDLAGAETTCVAYIGNITAMIHAMETGKDLHCLTASRIFDIPYEEVSREKYSAGVEGSDASQRDVGKRFNHSGNYGVGYKTLSDRFGWKLRDTKRFLEAYHAGYPEVKDSFQRQIMEMLKEKRRVWNCTGRSRIFLGRPEKIAEAAFSFPNQSTISDIINIWGLHYMWTDPLFNDTLLVNQIHDSIEFYVPVYDGYDYAAKVIHALCKNMEQPVRWKTREFVIGVTPSIMVNNHLNKEEFELCQTESLTSKYLMELHQSMKGQ